MADDIIALLKAHEYFRGIGNDTLREIVGIARVSDYSAGAVVHQFGDPLTSTCFVLRGRLKAVRVDAHGREHLIRIIERGDQYGIMLGGLGEPLPVRVFALEYSTTLRLDHEASMKFMCEHPDVGSQWVRNYAQRTAVRLQGYVQLCVQCGCVTPRIFRDASPYSPAYPAAAGVRGRDLRPWRRGHLAVDAGYAVSFAVRRRPTPGDDGDSAANCPVATGQTRCARCFGRSGPRDDRSVDGCRSHLVFRATWRNSVGRSSGFGRWT